MADDWEDEDEWDVDNNINPLTTSTKNISTVNDDFDNEEEDLAIVEKQKSAKIEAEMNKTKGKALLEKKRAEEERKEEMEIARRALELEAEMEENMTLEERRQLEKQRIESADHALTDDLFGAVDGSHPKTESSEPGDVVKMKDLKDHLKHARKVAQCIKVSHSHFVEVMTRNYIPPNQLKSSLRATARLH
jgi:translation initiation factor 3 subunit J